LEECERARRVAFDTPAAQIRGANAGAPVADASLARLLEELGGSLVVLEDVLSLLKLDGELVARGGIARITGAAELFGFSVSGMTTREREAGD
jgi:hypothetical protein